MGWWESAYRGACVAVISCCCAGGVVLYTSSSQLGAAVFAAQTAQVGEVVEWHQHEKAGGTVLRRLQVCPWRNCGVKADGKNVTPTPLPPAAFGYT